MAIEKAEFKKLFERARITDTKVRYFAEHQKILDRVEAEGSPQQKGALTRMLQQQQEDRTSDTGGMDI
jgi:hypothetical protein